MKTKIAVLVLAICVLIAAAGCDLAKNEKKAIRDADGFIWSTPPGRRTPN